MGELQFVVCHDCKEKLDMDKWFLPKHEPKYLKEILIEHIKNIAYGIVNKIPNQKFDKAGYDLLKMFNFINFAGLHNGHKIEYLGQYSENYKSTKEYKNLGLNYFTKDLDFEKFFIHIPNVIEVSIILNELENEHIIEDWGELSWDFINFDGVKFWWSKKKYETAEHSDFSYINLSTEEIKKSHDMLKKLIKEKVKTQK